MISDKGTDRHFECTRLISAEQVITTIKKIPSFRPGKPADKPADKAEKAEKKDKK